MYIHSITDISYIYVLEVLVWTRISQKPEDIIDIIIAACLLLETFGCFSLLVNAEVKFNSTEKLLEANQKS